MEMDDVSDHFLGVKSFELDEKTQDLIKTSGALGNNEIGILHSGQPKTIEKYCDDFCRDTMERTKKCMDQQKITTGNFNKAYESTKIQISLLKGRFPKIEKISMNESEVSGLKTDLDDISEYMKKLNEEFTCETIMKDNLLQFVRDNMSLIQNLKNVVVIKQDEWKEGKNDKEKIEHLRKEFDIAKERADILETQVNKIRKKEGSIKKELKIREEHMKKICNEKLALYEKKFEVMRLECDTKVNEMKLELDKLRLETAEKNEKLETLNKSLQNITKEVEVKKSQITMLKKDVKDSKERYNDYFERVGRYQDFVKDQYKTQKERIKEYEGTTERLENEVKRLKEENRNVKSMKSVSVLSMNQIFWDERVCCCCLMGYVQLVKCGECRMSDRAKYCKGCFEIHCKDHVKTVVKKSVVKKSVDKKSVDKKIVKRGVVL